ncbi:Sodium channel protein Nach [Pseudolycoriella hygida]|uniref:Sodium channel protein Nach n=1 Tax=Pseudolycoriella hygida TaxID=35572 RepID=A0A9Q0RYT2_9DIPT|nr:Sodium channel protein Nach [Pseudolycoriella hygida]
MLKVSYHRSNKKRKNQNRVGDRKITKWKCFCKALVVVIQNFCTTSSFVPLRHAFEKKRTKLDVFIWVTATILLSILTGFFVDEFMTNYYAMSTRTLVETNQRATSLFSFPAITTCAASRFSYNKVYAFLNA